VKKQERLSRASNHERRRGRLRCRLHQPEPFCAGVSPWNRPFAGRVSQAAL